MSDPWLAFTLFLVVIIGCAAMTWYRPWWYQTRGETRYERYVSEEGAVVKYRVSGDVVTIDSITFVDKATKLPLIQPDQPFMLGIDGRPVCEMALIEVSYTDDGAWQARGRDTASLEKQWRTDGY